MSNNSSSPSFPVLGILGIVFIVLKLCHVIDWSWWWVTAPFWGAFPLFFVVLALGAIAAAASRK